MKIRIKKGTIDKILKKFNIPKKKVKIGMLIGGKKGNVITIDDCYRPKQIYECGGTISTIPINEYPKIINKFGNKVVGLIFYHREMPVHNSEVNEETRERCAKFGMPNLSMGINLKGDYSFYPKTNKLFIIE